MRVECRPRCVITNREIRTEALLEEALDEVVESALENGVAPATVAATLREQADRVESPDEDVEG